MDQIWAELRLKTDKAKKDVASYNTELIKNENLTKKVGVSGTQAFNQQATAANKAANAQKNIQKETVKTNQTFGSLKAGVMSLAGTMGIAFGTQQIIAFAKASVDAASDLNETISKTGELFGSSTDAVLRWSKTTATSIGQSSQQALDGAATFAIMGRAAGLSGDKLVDFSTDFTELASDLASFNNTSPDEAIQAIGAALRGEAEPIRRYGVLLTDATIKQEAMALGIIKTTKEALTPQQRILAVQAAIYKQTSAAQGDFARTSEGLANQQRILAAQWKDMQANLGSGLIPVLSDVLQGINAIVGGDFSTSGIDKMEKAFDRWFVLLKAIPSPIGGAIKGFMSLRGAIQSFQNGDILGGVVKGFEAMGNVITFGLYDTVKSFFVPAKKTVVDGLTEMDKKLLQVANATDAEINAKFQELGGTATQTGIAFKKFADELRENLIEKTFKELIKVLDITEKQYARMVDISNKYGISARITSDAILELKQASGSQLEQVFQKLHEKLGVTRKDFNDYLGIVEELNPLTDELGKSTEKLIGPYDRLTQAVSTSMKSLQDLAALSLRGSASLNSMQKSVNNLNEDAFRLALANNLVTASIGDLSKELEDMSKFMDSEGQFLFTIPGGDDELQKIKELLTLYKERQAFLRESQAHDDELKRQHIANIDEIERRRIEAIELEKQQIEERQIYYTKADEILKELGVRRVDNYEEMLKNLKTLRDQDVISVEEYTEGVKEIERKRFQEQWEAISDLAGAFSGLAKNLGQLLSNIFGEAAQKNVAFLAFTKSIAIAEITLSSFQAIASGIAKLASTNPVDIIGGIAAIIGGVSNFIGGIISQVESIDAPAVPSFEKGTGFVKRGNNPPGVDTIPAMLNEGEGVVNTPANASYPGLVDALNAGIGDEYIMKHFVEPVLRAEEKSLPDQLAASMLLQKGKDFDDFRLLRNGKEQTSLLRENNYLLKKSLSQGLNNRNIN